MSACVLIDARGVATLEVPDADGEVRSYAVSPAPAGLDAAAVRVERIDTGASYRVARDFRGRWRCSCPDALYRGRPRRLQCKHMAAVAPLFALIERIKP